MVIYQIHASPLESKGYVTFNLDGSSLATSADVRNEKSAVEKCRYV